MDNKKAGALIFRLRKEKGFTQKQLADAMNISEQAISKWERGLGLPDVSLLSELSALLEVNISKILAGDLQPNDTDGGDMKRIKFYVCPDCGNVMTATGNAEISCCGRKLSPLVPKPCDEAHTLSVQLVEDDFYITFSHPMEKAHYLNFIAYVRFDRILLLRLYPEQGGEARIPQLRGGTLYFCCNEHGLFEMR